VAAAKLGVESAFVGCIGEDAFGALLRDTLVKYNVNIDGLQVTPLTNTTLAVVGVALNAIDLSRFDKLSMVLYALMGWLVVVAIRSIVAALEPLELFLLVAGGVAYTGGIVFYKSRKKYMHFVWHLCVMVGSALQYACIVLCCL